MLDGLKLRCPNLAPARWLTAPELVENGFPLAVVEPTGEIQRKPRTATYKGVTFTVTPSMLNDQRLTLAGSLHKYHNGGTVNSGRFTLADIQTAVHDLSIRFGVEPDSTLVENVEIGVNVALPFCPSRVIDAAIVCQNKPFTLFDGSKPKLGKRCVLSDYEVKYYDKGKQSGDPRAHVLRVEVKVKKMRYLDAYGVVLLADLTNPAKVRPLVEVLLSAINATVFIDPRADLANLTPSEQAAYYQHRDPLTWSRPAIAGDRWKRQDYRQRLNRLLKKCNAFDYGRDLLNRVVEEWQVLADVAGNTPTNSHENGLNEADKKATFSPLEYVGESVAKPTIEKGEGETTYFLPDSPKNKCCVSCGKPLIGQQDNSRFCSEKYNGHKAARQCRNRDSNKRRTKRNKVMRAKEKNQFLRITYSRNGETYTDTLHSLEVAVSREWLDTVVSVELLPICPNANLSGPDCYGHCKCVATSTTWNGNDARQRLAELTAQNAPE